MASSNNGALVSFPSGTKDVFLTHPGAATNGGMAGAFDRDARKIVVTAAQLKAAFSTPITIYPAVVDRICVPAQRMTFRKLSGTAYVLNGNTVMRVQIGANLVSLLNLTLTGFLDQTIERNYNWYGGGGAGIFTNALVLSLVNQPLTLQLNVADMVTGSGDLEVAFAMERYPLFYDFPAW